MILFFQATGMDINLEKSCIRTHALNDDLKSIMRSLLPYTQVDLDVCLNTWAFIYYQMHILSKIGSGLLRKFKRVWVVG
jgi:hypothetical protein